MQSSRDPKRIKLPHLSKPAPPFASRTRHQISGTPGLSASTGYRIPNCRLQPAHAATVVPRHCELQGLPLPDCISNAHHYHILRWNHIPFLVILAQGNLHIGGSCGSHAAAAHKLPRREYLPRGQLQKEWVYHTCYCLRKL